MAKEVSLYEFPETDESNRKSKPCFRLLALLIVSSVILAILFGTLFVINKFSSEYNILHDTTETTSILHEKITDLKQLHTVKEFEKLILSASDSSKSKDIVKNKPEVSTSDEWASFEDFFRFDNNEDSTNVDDSKEDNSLILNESTVNVNRDCEKSPFDKEFVKTLTQDERNAVEQLMKKVTYKLTDTFCDASSESYLVRWLKYQNWNVEKAAQSLFHTIAWRKKENINELQNEDFSYLDEAFPLFTDGKDYTGRVVVTVDAASVDSRKMLLSGKGHQILRYLARGADKVLNSTREAQFRGENVTQGFMIINYKGFNRKQHACDKCISFMFQYLNLLEEHYPLCFFKYLIINTPHEFEWMLHLAKSVLPSYINEAIEIFGTNKQEWQKVVLKYIPPDQIRPQFGGNKTNDH